MSVVMIEQVLVEHQRRVDEVSRRFAVGGEPRAGRPRVRRRRRRRAPGGAPAVMGT